MKNSVHGLVERWSELHRTGLGEADYDEMLQIEKSVALIPARNPEEIVDKLRMLTIAKEQAAIYDSAMRDLCALSASLGLASLQSVALIAAATVLVMFSSPQSLPAVALTLSKMFDQLPA
jgi:hypothetical protein